MIYCEKQQGMDGHIDLIDLQNSKGAKASRENRSITSAGFHLQDSPPERKKGLHRDWTCAIQNITSANPMRKPLPVIYKYWLPIQKLFHMPKHTPKTWTDQTIQLAQEQHIINTQNKNGNLKKEVVVLHDQIS